MKNRLIIVAIFILSLTTSYNSLSQNVTNESENIKSIISKKRNYNKTHGFGYRIQLYNGNEQRARKIRATFKQMFPDNFSKLKYEEPEWKVQVGSYKTKLEADKDLIRFEKKFSGIIVIPMTR
ncbi:MAG: SPOR domain-containing protein [Flavobacteriaceae bacterium]